MFCNTETHEVRGLPDIKNQTGYLFDLQFPGRGIKRNAVRIIRELRVEEPGIKRVNVKMDGNVLKATGLQPVSQSPRCLSQTPIPAGTLSFRDAQQSRFPSES